MNGKKLFTPEQEAYLRSIIPGRPTPDVLAIINDKYQLNLSLSQLRAWLANRGIRNGLKLGPGDRAPYRLPIGSKTVDPSRGYHLTKVREGTRGWVPDHILLWEQHHGPLPKNMFLIFANGNKDDIRLDNLLLVTRGELGLLNVRGWIGDDPEITKTRLLMVRLDRVKKARRKPTKGVKSNAN